MSTFGRYRSQSRHAFLLLVVSEDGLVDAKDVGLVVAEGADDFGERTAPCKIKIR